jgi:hypothetical protein
MKKKKSSRVVVRKYNRKFEMEEVLIKIVKIFLRDKS